MIERERERDREIIMIEKERWSQSKTVEQRGSCHASEEPFRSHCIRHPAPTCAFFIV